MKKYYVAAKRDEFTDITKDLGIYETIKEALIDVADIADTGDAVDLYEVSFKKVKFGFLSFNAALKRTKK